MVISCRARQICYFHFGSSDLFSVADYVSTLLEDIVPDDSLKRHLLSSAGGISDLHASIASRSPRAGRLGRGRDPVGK